MHQKNLNNTSRANSVSPDKKKATDLFNATVGSSIANKHHAKKRSQGFSFPVYLRSENYHIVEGRTDQKSNLQCLPNG